MKDTKNMKQIFNKLKNNNLTTVANAKAIMLQLNGEENKDNKLNNNMEKNIMNDLMSKIDIIMSDTQLIKEGCAKKLYTSQELCKYLGVGKSVIDKARQNGEITYSKVGQSYVFTQNDVDEYLIRNRVNYVA